MRGQGAYGKGTYDLPCIYKGNRSGGWLAARKYPRFRLQDREWRQRGKWLQMDASVWTQERVTLSPGCR